MGKDVEVAILFADVVGSTRIYEIMGDLRARDMVLTCVEIMRSATEQNHGSVIKTIGDEIMATFPTSNDASRWKASRSPFASAAITVRSWSRTGISSAPPSIRPIA